MVVVVSVVVVVVVVDANVVVVEVVVVAVRVRARIRAKITPATREAKMYFLYFRNHSAHGEDVGPSSEVKAAVGSHL